VFLEYNKLSPEDPRGKVFAISCELALIWANEKDESEVHEIKKLNTKAPEFSPTYYKDGLLYLSSRKGSKSSRKDKAGRENLSGSRRGHYKLSLQCISRP